MNEKSRQIVGFFRFHLQRKQAYLKMLPRMERTILLPMPRPMVVAVVLSVFSKAF